MKIRGLMSIQSVVSYGFGDVEIMVSFSFHLSCPTVCHLSEEYGDCMGKEFGIEKTSALKNMEKKHRLSHVKTSTSEHWDNLTL